MGINANKSVESGKVKQVKKSAYNYYRQAERLRNRNKYKEAVEKYLKSIFMNRNNASSYMGLGLAYKNINCMEKAEKITPYDVKVQKELAMCHIINGDFESGIKHLINAIKLEPDNPDIQMQLALVHEMIEEEDMALRIYGRIIEIYPNYIRAYIQKGTLYMHLEDYINSAKMFKEVINKNPEYYRAYLAIGICYEKLENYRGARRYYKKYIKTCPVLDNYKEITGRIKELKKLNKCNKTELKIVR